MVCLKQQLCDYTAKVSAVAGIGTRKDVIRIQASVEHVQSSELITIQTAVRVQ